MQQQTNFLTISTDELISLITSTIEHVLSQALPAPVQAPTENNLLTREQAAKKLHITLPTLHKWTKEGRLIVYRMSKRVYYKIEEIEQVIQSSCYKYGNQNK